MKITITQWVMVSFFLSSFLYLFRFLMLSAWGLLIYCSTICFHLLLHSQPLKKLCTFFIFLNSTDSSDRPWPVDPVAPALSTEFVDWLTLYVTGLHSFFKAHSWKILCKKILIIYSVLIFKFINKLYYIRFNLYDLFSYAVRQRYNMIYLYFSFTSEKDLINPLRCKMHIISRILPESKRKKRGVGDFHIIFLKDDKQCKLLIKFEKKNSNVTDFNVRLRWIWHEFLKDLRVFLLQITFDVNLKRSWNFSRSSANG